MHILFSTYSLAFQNIGGGEQVLNAMRSQLTQKGHKVDIFNSWDPHTTSFSQFDIIHYFSCIDPYFWRFIKINAPSTPLIVTPTYRQETSVSQRIRFSAKRLFHRLRGNKPIFDFPDFWLPNTATEAHDLETYQGVPPQRIGILPNGVDDRFFNADPKLFLSTVKIQSPFVLHVGRFHPVKNQLALIEAIKQAQLKCVFIGSPDRENLAYYQQCRKSAETAETADVSRRTQFFFLDYIDPEQELLPSAYAAASVFALPSQFETFGLVALEAAVAGKPLILTKNMASYSIFQEVAHFIDPNQPDSIRDAILKAIQIPYKDRSQEFLKKYHWRQICETLLGHYENTLERLKK